MGQRRLQRSEVLVCFKDKGPARCKRMIACTLQTQITNNKTLHGNTKCKAAILMQVQLSCPALGRRLLYGVFDIAHYTLEATFLDFMD